ncbi:hypothetical protein PDM28_04520 [Stenotrophomonas aracearum]|jgi:hypothetical protein|uniref:Toxin co-regulated pilus biosynthesis protein Q C-terminal domain-containing protein n=1 Tax=Stenotrophomonas aracearum TaxID=3003272 RepID=A0ABY9YFE5_9GAMM|nr:hypothetical protein [Stenotrophomonas sp. A5588]WNH49587.1 hypothetical protein PDM28_04520 [Stenotrophomonas sp. A5588]
MKKIETRIATALAAALLLTAQGAAAPSHPEQEERPNKPGFFRQLGSSLKDAGQQMVGVKPTQGGANASADGGAIYVPVSGAGKLPGLFKQDNHQQAQLGKLDWPRVALTYTEWGTTLPCWTVEARIWTSASASTTETFRTCANAALTETDDLGDSAELNTSALWKGRDTLMGVRVPPSKPNTGATRSSGPTPPSQPFVVNVSRPGVSDKAVQVALRVAWVSGFIQTADIYPGASGLLTPFKDGRMWIAGFKPEGNRDR